MCMVKDAVTTDRPAPASVVKVLFTRDDMLRATVLAAYSIDICMVQQTITPMSLPCTENFTIIDFTTR